MEYKCTMNAVVAQVGGTAFHQVGSINQEKLCRNWWEMKLLNGRWLGCPGG